jgi:nitrite reductase/ring-hydroxylating ferredoxin subunit/uncharacterized membrane protein
MKSRASIKSHPLHPILIAFPIAFFTGTAVAHAVGWLLDKPGLLYTATVLNLAGVCAAVLAAVPGLIDFIYTVPPQSSGKKRAAQHGIINTIMLLIFVAAALYRRKAEVNHAILLSIEIAGIILMSIAGWLGGTLVYRNQIGVDHRYANAGKWNEAYFDQEGGRIEVAAADELKMNAMKLLHLKSRRIVLAKTQEGYKAFDDRCPHKGGSLAGGTISCNIVTCPWHGSQFLVTDGHLKAGPSTEGIKTYQVAESDGKIYLFLS